MIYDKITISRYQDLYTIPILFSFKIDPPHEWKATPSPKSNWYEICHGNSPFSASCPPTILPPIPDLYAFNGVFFKTDGLGT